MPSITREPLQVIVMPPAHGKTYSLEKFKNVSESDWVYDYHSNEELFRLRKEAKEGKRTWEEFDRKYAEILNEECSTLWIMVPSVDLGEKVGIVRHVFTLPLKICEENIAQRGKTYREYMGVYEQAQKHPLHIYCPTLDHMQLNLRNALQGAPARRKITSCPDPDQGWDSDSYDY